MVALRILMIDDEPHVREFVHDALASFGYAVDVAANGAQGLALFDEHHYDLLVLDLRMPQLGGWDVLRAVTGKRPTRAVIISGSITPLDEEQAREAGVPILRKPFTLSQLKRLVQEGLTGQPCAMPRKPAGEER